MRVYKIFLHIFIFLAGIVLFLFFLFWDLDQNSSLEAFLHKPWGRNIGGIIINNTSHSIKVADSTKIFNVPPKKSTRDIKLFDTDAMIIDNPVFFEGKKYSKGIIRICDFTVLKISSKNNVDKAVPNLSYNSCKALGDGGWFATMKEAFSPDN